MVPLSLIICSTLLLRQSIHLQVYIQASPFLKQLQYYFIHPVLEQQQPT
jgi:hypothetical protein